MGNEKVFITNYNLLRLFESDDRYSMNLDKFPAILDAFKMLTLADRSRFGALDKFLSSEANDFSGFKIKRSVTVNRDGIDEMVYKPKPPAYHSSLACENLKSDYENFRIPEVIIERGEIDEFRAWFLANSELYHRDFEAFKFRLHARFGADVFVEQIKIDNSGSAEVEVLTLESLKGKIDYHIFNAKYEMDRNDVNRAVFEKHKWHYSRVYITEPGVFKNETDYPDDLVIDIVKNFNRRYIIPLKKMIIDYMILAESCNANVDKKLIEAIGFRPCSKCMR